MQFILEKISEIDVGLGGEKEKKEEEELKKEEEEEEVEEGTEEIDERERGEGRRGAIGAVS